MRFSIYTNPQTRGAHEDVELIETVTRQAITATNAGFVGVALTEHHFSNYNTYGDNFLFGAYLAPQLRPGSMITLACAVPTLHNPARLAQSINLLDIMTKGNAIIGFAPGGSPVEYAAMGRDPSIRQEDYFKTLEIVEELQAFKPEDDMYEWATAGESGRVTTRLMPGAYTEAGPKLARATQHNEGVEWTGRKGWYLLTARETPDQLEERWGVYEDALRTTDLSEDDIQHRLDWSFVQKQVFVADSVEEAREAIIPRLAMVAEMASNIYNPKRDPEIAQQLKTILGASADNPDEFIRLACIIGDPDSVADQIRQYEAAGPRHMALVFNWGFMSPEVSDRSLNRFIKEVLPQFQSALAAA